MAVLLALVATPAAAAGNSGMCDLIRQLQGVFQILRVCAFVGAGFMIAKYGWEAISTGKLGGKDNIADGLKVVGVPLIIGVALLFSIGMVLGFLMDGRIVDCADVLRAW